jgi:hypothetical protein
MASLRPLLVLGWLGLAACACADAAQPDRVGAGRLPPSTGDVLYASGFDAPGGCGGESPRLIHRNPGTTIADCDHEGLVLSGTQSVRMAFGESIACPDCWSPDAAAELWMQTLVRMEEAFSDAWLLFQPIDARIQPPGGSGPAYELNQRRVGPFVMWDRREGGLGLMMMCGLGEATVQTSGRVAAGTGQPMIVRMHFSYETKQGELWARPAPFTGDFGPADATIDCRAHAASRPTGFFSEGFFANPPSGLGYQDDLVVAKTAAALDVAR